MHLCKQSLEKTYFKYSFEMLSGCDVCCTTSRENFTVLAEKLLPSVYLILEIFVVFFFFSSLFCREKDELDLAKGMEQSIAFQVSLTCFCLMLVFIKLSKLPKGCEGGLCKTFCFGL